jgi:hypothetical protein
MDETFSPFCIFVRNRIYVLEIEMLEPAVLARNHNFETSLNCCDIHSISKNLHQMILARYHSLQELYFYKAPHIITTFFQDHKPGCQPEKILNA